MPPSAPTSEGSPRDRSWWVSAALGSVAAVLYGRTLCPTVSWYDSAEFSASAASLRVVPHPPGYPLYTILGHVFSWLPGEAAWGLNVMSAVFGVLAVVLLHRVALRLPLRAVAAVVPPAMLAVAPSVWANAVVAEVYTPGLSFLLGALLLCLLARDRAQPRWAWAGAFVAGLGLGVHMSLATWGLGFAALVGAAGWPAFREDPRAALLRWGLGCAVAALLGACVFLLIPFGPFETVTPLGPYEDSFPRLWQRFVADLQGGVFRRYFKPMPTAQRLTRICGILGDNLGVAGLVAAVAGAVAAVLRARWVAAALLLGAVGNVAFFFRYDVPDLDVFLLPTVVSLALLAGWGVEAAFRARAGLGWLGAAVLGVLLGGEAVRTLPEVDRSDDRAARVYGEEACAGLPEGALLVMTSRPDEWRRYSVLLYMHESQEACLDTEFWGMATVPMIEQALFERRAVYAYVADPRFASKFRIEPAGRLFRVMPSLGRPRPETP